MTHTQDLYQQITNQIIEALDQTTPWALPWHQKSLTLPRNVVSQKTYTGVNVLSLWIAAIFYAARQATLAANFLKDVGGLE